MEMPASKPNEVAGKSAAAAKKVKVAPRTVAAIEPNSVRAINAARQKEYMAKGGRQPIGAAGSGGNSSMAGSNMSTAKGIVAGIKAGFNPKVSLDPYESERAKKVGPRSLKLKKESVDEALSPERKRMFDLKLKYIKKAANRKDRAKPSKVDTPRTALNPAADMKLNPKPMDTRTWDYIMKNEEAEQIEEGNPANKAKKKEAIRQLGLKAMAAGKVDKARGYIPQRAGREQLKKEETEMNEVTKSEAEKVLGGPVKTKPKMPPGKQPAGYRYVRGLARKAMKAGMKKDEYDSPARKAMERELQYNPKYRMEEVEQVGEARRMSAAEKLGRAFDSEQQRSALSRQRGLDLLKQKDTEKMQNKPASGNMTKIKKEETEESTMKYIEEKLTAADPASKWISDFVKSDNPKFAGKSKKERIQQALGAYYAKKRGTNEEVETVDEGRLRRSMRGYAVLGGYGYGNKVRNQSAGERSREINVGLDDKQEKENARRAAEADKAKMKKEEVEQMDEVNARNSFVATQQALTPRAKDVKASVGTTRRDAAVTNKYARRISKLTSGAYSKQDVKGNLKSLAKEEAEQIDELKASTLGSYIAKSSADEKSRREKGVAVSKELSAKTGMKFGTPFDPKIHSKNASRSANRAVAIKKLTGQAKVNANEAAEGKVAVTPKEKSLAAHHGDKTKITFGDVLKARLKSAAAKKMGK